jgi:hypothetical protein
MDSNLVDIVRTIIDRIDLNIAVKSIVGNKIFVCNTMHITLGKIVKDEFGNKYKVTDFSFNEWIEVVPVNGSPNPFDSTIVVAPEILFLHGSPSSTNNEFAKINNRTLKKTPFIWLLVSYEYENLPADSSIVASYNARLFFMDWANTPKWKNDQHNQLVIKPMENLSDAFIKVIEDDYTFRRLEAYTRRPRPRFGVEISDKGSDKTIIHENLSGIDLSVKLDMYNTTLCC